MDHSKNNVRSLFMPPRRHFLNQQIAETIGQRLARLRKERGMSQAELAAKLHMAQPNVSDYERGVIRPNIEIIVALTRILKVSADELLGLESSPREPIVKDRRLLQHVALIERLPRRDREALLRTIRLYVGRVQ